MKRINIIQELRGYGVCWVILAHLSFIEEKYAGGTDYIPDYVMFGSSGVDVFFVISGFMMVYINYNRPGGWKASLSFAYDRLVRVYPMYWLYCLPLVPLYFIFPHLINSADGNQANILRSILLVPDENLPLLPVAWTLIHEVYFYTVITVLMFLPVATRWWGIVVWALLCIGCMAFSDSLRLGQPLVALLTNPINLEFVLGAGIAVLLLSGRAPLAVPMLIIGLFLYIAGYCGYVWFTHQTMIDRNWRVLLAGVPVTMIIYGLVTIENRNGFTLAKPLRLVGDISYSAYLSHLLILSALGKVWAMSRLQGPFYSIIWLAAAVVLSLAWAVISYRYLEIPSWQYAKHRNPFHTRTGARNVVDLPLEKAVLQEGPR